MNPNQPPSELSLKPSSEGDYQYYKRAFNLRWIWNLQHKPRNKMMDYFFEIMQPKESDAVLDLGTTNVPHPMENIFEYRYPFKSCITAAGTEDCSFLEKQYAGLRFVRTRSHQPLPFKDNAFDIGFSNAVIEHVGSREWQAHFLSELIRVSRKCFITTPNRAYPIELHTRLPFVHWLPHSVYRPIFKRLGFDFYSKENNLNLLYEKEFVDLVAPKNFEIILRKNYFLGFPSNLMLIIKKPQC